MSTGISRFGVTRAARTRSRHGRARPRLLAGPSKPPLVLDGDPGWGHLEAEAGIAPQLYGAWLVWLALMGSRPPRVTWSVPQFPRVQSAVGQARLLQSHGGRSVTDPECRVAWSWLSEDRRTSGRLGAPACAWAALQGKAGPGRWLSSPHLGAARRAGLDAWGLGKTVPGVSPGSPGERGERPPGAGPGPCASGCVTSAALAHMPRGADLARGCVVLHCAIEAPQLLGPRASGWFVAGCVHVTRTKQITVPVFLGLRSVLGHVAD